MLVFKLVIFTLTLAQYINSSDGGSTVCPKGKRVKVSRGGGCEVCPDGSYQPDNNYSQQCKACTNCEANRGSFVKEECTKETDRKCECRKGFVPLEKDSSTCKCDPGFGLKDGECSQCEDGYFNNRINSPCRKWKECTSGVNITGSRTSDVICNHLRTDYNITKHVITQLTSHRPFEKTQTTTTNTVATTTGTPPQTVEPTRSSNTGNYIGMGLLMFGIIGLLVLTAFTCKLHITANCMQRKTAVQTKDSCRRPVEESGNSRSSLKLNPEEP
ncbi:hypothetical protein Q5P01_001534 [Channa striata]|uniref:TNFR-Cys domain-containing protein n=1 Tax=Channa striata TaxID=64152 RepID=A0AA88NR34_CHASR|nr:hypothetical protein Q5P01_001534 [Channa striata]